VWDDTEKSGGPCRNRRAARSAQRGLLVILASAVIWIAVIWIGYRVLY